MKKAILYLLLLLTAAFLIVAVLVYTAPDPDKQAAGFKREYLLPGALPAFAAIPTFGNIRDILAIHHDHLFFSTNDPSILLFSDTLLRMSPHKNRKNINISPGLRDSMRNDFFTLMEDDQIYICAYNIPAIAPADSSSHYKRLPYGGFSQAVLMRDGNFMLRKLEPGIKDQLFMHLDTSTWSLTGEKGLSEIYHDGGMRTDGSLNYDITTGLLTYVHYYSNGFFTFDNSMQLRSKGHTIDTFSHYRFRLAEGNKKVFTGEGPDQLVNAHSCAYSGILYVNSKIRADNDDYRFRRHNVIDMYSLADNSYKGSLYLDIPANAGIGQLFVYGNILLAKCEDSVYGFRLPF